LSKFDLSNLDGTNPVYIVQSRSTLDYVTIQGEFETTANLFIRYIKSKALLTDDKLAQIIKPMEPPNAIRGLSAACKSNTANVIYSMCYLIVDGSFRLVFTKLHQVQLPVLVLVVYQRHSSVNVDALKFLQRTLDRLSTTLKPYIQLTEKTSKQLVRLASTQTSNMYS
jgi:hypothetical protein